MIGLVAKLIVRNTMTTAQKQALAKAIVASAKARRKNKLGGIFNPSTRNTKKLAKLEKRIAQNKAKLKSIKTGSDSIIRMQNSKGLGFVKKRILPPKPIGTSKGKPFPVNPSQNLEKLRRSFPDEKFEHLKFDRSMKFGFKDMKQAKRYFTKQEIEWYKSKGYNLTRVNNIKINAQSRNQLVFTQAKNATSTQAEAAKLTAKYKKLIKGIA